MICVALVHLAMHSILMSYQVAVSNKGATADVTFIRGVRRVGANVNRELTL